MTLTYSTVDGTAEGLYKEKGSRFLSFLIPVESEDEAKQAIAGFRRQYHDARHVCYAYVIGADRATSRMSDDGEPSGTAGRPIMAQIEKRELTNVLAIVVRYFGGILLGTGGLIVAYRSATADALDHAVITQRDVMTTRTLRFAHERTGPVMRIAKECEADITGTQYDTTHCRLTLRLKASEAGRFDTRIGDLRLEQ